MERNMIASTTRWLGHAARAGAILAFFCSVALAAEGSQMQTDIRIEADESLEYAGHCISQKTAKKLDIHGKGAQTIAIEGGAVLCELEIVAGETPLVLEIINESGNRSRTSTRGIGSKVRLKVG